MTEPEDGVELTPRQAREVGLDDIEGLMLKVQGRQRTLIFTVIAQSLLIVFLCVVVGVLTHSLTVRDQRRSVTIDALAAFAENNNCVNQRGESFDDSVINILATLTVQERQAVITAYNAIPKCAPVVLPGIPKSKTQHSTTTTTKEKTP